MFKTTRVPPPMLAAAALGSLLATLALRPAVACGQNQATSTVNYALSAPAQPPKSTSDVLVTVNGVPITEADVRFALDRGGHDEELPQEHRKNILETVIRRELIRQRAVELDLDANAAYQEKLRRMEAQLNAFKREELAELFFRHEIAGKAAITEAEARKYFEDNASRIRTERHVWQILSRKEAVIEKALNDLQQGTSFEDVARRRFPNLPKMDRAPWDLGYLKWKQVPKPWRRVLDDLKNGEVSGVIRGPNNRFWIIKLLDKRENPDITFESIRPTIIADLKNAKIEELSKKARQALRAKASIVYSNGRVDVADE